MDQDGSHLPHPGANQRLRSQGCQGGHQVFPAHSRQRSVNISITFHFLFCLPLPPTVKLVNFELDFDRICPFSEAYILKHLMFEGKSNKRSTK